jgi:hypothetical protein
VLIQVFEGERKMTKDNNKLGELLLEGLEPAPRGVPQIEVTFDLDVNQVLIVSARDKATGKENEITIANDKGRLSQDDIERMVREFKQFAAEDDAMLEKVEAKSALENYANSMRKTINDAKMKGKIDADDREAIETAINETTTWLDGNQTAEKEEYDAAQETLEGICNRIMMKVYRGDSSVRTQLAEASELGFDSNEAWQHAVIDAARDQDWATLKRLTLPEKGEISEMARMPDALLNSRPAVRTMTMLHQLAYAGDSAEPTLRALVAAGCRLDPGVVTSVTARSEDERGKTAPELARAQGHEHFGALLEHLPDLEQLAAGCPVEVSGLKSAPQHNGNRGKVVKFDPSRGRYHVQLYSGGNDLWLRRLHLVVIVEGLQLGPEPEAPEMIPPVSVLNPMGWTLADSHFRAQYISQTMKVTLSTEVFANVDGFLHSFFTAPGRGLQTQAHLMPVRHFVERLRQQATEAGIDPMGDAGEAAELVWSSQLRLEGVEGYGKELCGFINQALRENLATAGLAWRLAGVVRAINAVRQIRGRSQHADRFPPGGRTYRGGGFDTKFRGFFSVGKKYRVPGFLATSFDEMVAITFRDTHACVPPGGERILWVVHVDPAGDIDRSRRCKHAYLIRSHLPKEAEFLFTAFSVFTVRSVLWAEDGSSSRVELDAAMDHETEPEDLPLAPWY